jgi:hypothetical protein
LFDQFFTFSEVNRTGGIVLTRVRGNAFRESRETVIDDIELGQAMDKARSIDNEYFRLRALAVLSLLRLSGKRRTEISWIPLENFKIENDLLNVTFSLEKKRHKHKKCPGCGTKNPTTSSFCKKCGLGISQVPIAFTSKQAKSLKAFPLSDPLTQNVLRYYEYLSSLNVTPKFWLPSGRCGVRELLHNSRQTLERPRSIQHSQRRKRDSMAAPFRER